MISHIKHHYLHISLASCILHDLLPSRNKMLLNLIHLNPAELKFLHHFAVQVNNQDNYLQRIEAGSQEIVMWRVHDLLFQLVQEEENVFIS